MKSATLNWHEIFPSDAVPAPEWNQIYEDFRLKLSSLFRDRMNKRKLDSCKKKTFSTKHFTLGTIFLIAHDRTPQRSHMNPQLMSPAGEGGKLHQGEFPASQ